MGSDPVSGYQLLTGSDLNDDPIDIELGRRGRRRDQSPLSSTVQTAAATAPQRPRNARRDSIGDTSFASITVIRRTSRLASINLAQIITAENGPQTAASSHSARPMARMASAIRSRICWEPVCHVLGNR